MNAIIVSLLAALLFLFGVGQATGSGADAGEENGIVGTPDEDESGLDNDSEDEDVADSGDADNPLGSIEGLMNGYFNGLGAYYNDGNEGVFNYLENNSGNLYDQIVESKESGEYENFVVTYWQITNIDTLQQGVYMITMDREYQYGDGKTGSDEVTYAIRETNGELAIVDQEPDDGSGVVVDNGNDEEADEGDEESDNPLVDVEPLMNGYFQSLRAYYNGVDEYVFHYLENDTSDLYNQIVENNESGNFENFVITYWQVTDVETLEDDLYKVTMDRQYEFNDGSTGNDRVTYLIQETDQGLKIVEQE